MGEGHDWEFQHAALHGSSYYDLPPVLNWFTGNIGVHHVHHLSAKVPGYRLQEVLRDYPELRGIGRVTLLDSLRCVKLALWDESRRKLVSFREARMALRAVRIVRPPRHRRGGPEHPGSGGLALVAHQDLAVADLGAEHLQAFAHEGGRPGQPLAETSLPSTWAPVGATSM